MQTVMILICGSVIFVGLYWQYKLWDATDEDFIDFLPDLLDLDFEYLPKRMLAPIILGAVLILGTIVWGIIVVFFDDRVAVTGFEAITISFKMLVLTLFWCVKSFFGPIVLSFLACVSIYFLFTYGELRSFPLLAPMLAWVFDQLPTWVELIYLAVFIVNAIGGSLLDLDTWKGDALK